MPIESSSSSRARVCEIELMDPSGDVRVTVGSKTPGVTGGMLQREKLGYASTVLELTQIDSSATMCGC